MSHHVPLRSLRVDGNTMVRQRTVGEAVVPRRDEGGGRVVRTQVDICRGQGNEMYYILLCLGPLLVTMPCRQAIQWRGDYIRDQITHPVSYD